MGAIPAVNAVLVDATPYRLRYLLASTGQPGSAVLTNQNSLPAPSGVIIGGVDLRVNALSAAAAGTLGLPLLELLRVPVANQAEARRLLMGEGGSPPTLVATGKHAHANAQARGADVPSIGVGGAWAVDANEGAAAGAAASAGFAVLVITPPQAVVNFTGYLDLHFQNTEAL